MSKPINKRHVASLLHDSLGWTPVGKITSKGIQVIRKGIRMLYKDVIHSHELVSLQDELLQAGMATLPTDFLQCANSIKPNSMVLIVGIAAFENKIGRVICADFEPSDPNTYDWIVDTGDVGNPLPCWEKEILLLPTNE